MNARSTGAVNGWIASTALLALAGAAWGQNALGDGTGLSRPLQRDLGRGVPVGRPNTAAAFQREVALRNAIVTGNSAGGMSFRGDSGYTAPTEFRGELGSNDLFAFRRDSLFSGFAGLGLRGTDALQYQFALATGSSAGVLGVGPVARSGGGIGRQAQTPLGDPTFVQDLTTRRDPTIVPTGTANSTAATGSMMGMLRTPSAYVVNRSIQPEIMASFLDATTNINWGLTASGLRGVRMSRMMLAEDQLTRPGAVELTATPSLAAGPGQPGEASPVEGATRGPTLTVPNSYQAMVERFRDAAAGRLVAPPAEIPGEAPVTPGTEPTATPGTAPGTAPATGPGGVPSGSMAPGTPEWERRLSEIRDRLSRDYLDLSTGTTTPPTGPAGEEIEENRAEGTTPGSLTYRPLDAEALRILRESPPRVSGYVDAGSTADVYAEHMAVAGQLMRSGAYFDAEERFTRAQAVRSDDFLATIGRLHAQVGAGMYLSAGMNLRRLLTDHPEVAATRFDSAMLPETARLDKVANELRSNASRALDGQSVMLGTDSALLLAYMGYQREDAPLITEGLETYRRLLDASGQASAAGRTLLDLITQVWGNPAQEGP